MRMVRACSGSVVIGELLFALTMVGGLWTFEVMPLSDIMCIAFFHLGIICACFADWLAGLIVERGWFKRE